jgi:hypothetical protein
MRNLPTRIYLMTDDFDEDSDFYTIGNQDIHWAPHQYTEGNPCYYHEDYVNALKKELEKFKEFTWTDDKQRINKLLYEV